MKKWLRISLIILFSAVFLVSAYMIYDYYANSHKQAETFDQLAQMVQQATPPAPAATQPDEPMETNADVPVPTEPQPLPEYVAVSQLNPDMIGWMAIEGTKINYPVMQTPDRIDYYLHTDFYGNYSSHGCLYAREQCDITLPSDNITIYGHNMNDGSMFAGLSKYRNKSFWEEHRYITFDTLTEHHTYEIFAVFRTTASKGEGFTYHQFIDAKNPEEFDTYIADCKAIDLYDTGITPVYGDKLITLSTCEYSQKNGRFVVVAKRIN